MVEIDSGRALLETVKTAALSEGIRLTPAALDLVSKGGTEQLSIHEYPTTGGITLVLNDDVYLNAPFDEWYCQDADTLLDVERETSSLILRSAGGPVPVQDVLPLPGYLAATDGQGRLVADVAMSHADRVRVSPIVGCAYDCGFCDLPGEVYTQRPAEQMLRALEVARADAALPARHVLISGGSPRKTHYDQFIGNCEDVIRGTDLPVDVMFSPMIDRPDMLERLVAAGVDGVSINIEVFSEKGARVALRGKYRAVRDHFDATVAQAVDLLGRTGRVRSLIIAGLEPLEETLRGVEHLASLGCDPVLSPFRPAEGTPLRSSSPPPSGDLASLLAESRRIVRRHGVALGPECAPCQHNTLSFPWDIRDADRQRSSSAGRGTY